MSLLELYRPQPSMPNQRGQKLLKNAVLNKVGKELSYNFKNPFHLHLGVSLLTIGETIAWPGGADAVGLLVSISTTNFYCGWLNA
jgi:hypothetical protein